MTGSLLPAARATLVRSLAASDCDLDDEREVIRFLKSAGILFGDIVVFSDDVIERARHLRLRTMEVSARSVTSHGSS